MKTVTTAGLVSFLSTLTDGLRSGRVGDRKLQELQTALSVQAFVLPRAPRKKPSVVKQPRAVKATFRLAVSARDITLSCRERADHWRVFFESKDIKISKDFVLETEDVWYRNRPKMERAIELMGYDKVIIMPPNLDTVLLHQKLTVGYAPTFEWDSFSEAGGFPAITTPHSDRTRIILVHEKNARNNTDHPILKALRGKSIVALTGLPPEQVQTMLDRGENIPLKIPINGQTLTFNGLDVPGYLVWQQDFFDRTKTHLDEISWLSLPGSSIGKGKSGRRVPGLHWHSGIGRLGAGASDPGHRDGNLAPRPAAVFV